MVAGSASSCATPPFTPPRLRRGRAAFFSPQKTSPSGSSPASSATNRMSKLALSPKTPMKSLISKSSDAGNSPTYSQATTLVLGERSPKTVKKGKQHASSSSSRESPKSTGKKGNQIVKVKAIKVMKRCVIKSPRAMKAQAVVKKPASKGTGGAMKKVKNDRLFTAEISDASFVVLASKYWKSFSAVPGQITNMRNALGRAFDEYRDLELFNKSYGEKTEAWKPYPG